MMTVLSLFVILVGFVLITTEAKRCKIYTDTDIDVEFDKLQDRHAGLWAHSQGFPGSKKVSIPREERKRRFKLRAAKLNDHNRKGKGFCKKVNKFTAMEDEEKKAFLGGKFKKNISTRAARSILPMGDGLHLPTGVDLPLSVDNRHMTGPVESQGACGSCWAFSASHALTAAMYKKYGTVTSYSEQQLVDCTPDSSGCEGGMMFDAWNYLKTAPAKTDQEYPYYATDRNCSVANEDQGVTSGWTQLNGEVEMLLKVAQVPISIGFQVIDDFFEYDSGVYSTNLTCVDGNHGMVLVGYGVDLDILDDPIGDIPGGAYWLVKNSWGSDWGDAGYVRIKRGINLCVIGDYGMFPEVL